MQPLGVTLGDTKNIKIKKYRRELINYERNGLGCQVGGGGWGGGHVKTSLNVKRAGHSLTLRGSSLSQRRGIRYFAFLLRLNDRRLAGFLAFIQPVVQWITRQ